MLKIDNKTISTPIIDILKQIKAEINNGKLRDIRIMGDNIRVSCPFHKDGKENKPSCDIYIGEASGVEHGTYNCFTCGERGPFFKFVAACFDESIEFAKEWLIERFADGLLEYTVNLEPIDISKKRKKYLDEKILDTFQDYHPYMDKRKLTKQICNIFEVKYDPKTECLVFPVRDEKGKLALITRRSVKDKRFIIDKDKEKPIYLLYYLIEHDIKEAVLVESQINALTLFGWNIPAIASFGCNITDKQIDMINKSGIRHLYVCYDGDNAGIHGTKKVIDNLRKDIIIDVIEMDKGKDVNDITEERFDQLNIINSVDWLLKYKKQLV